MSKRYTVAEGDQPCICGHALYLHDDGKDLCLDCDCRTFAAKPDLCIRWGTGADRCIRSFDHVGVCKDSTGNTTLTLAAQYLGVNRD